MKKTTCFGGHFYLEVGAKFGSRDKGSCGKRFDFCDAAITTMLIIWTGSADVLTAVGTRQDCGASPFAKNYKMLWFFKNNLINYYFKGQCHEIFDLYFFSLIEPIWSPDKQAKMVFLKNLFSQRYSNLKFEKISARSRFFFQMVFCSLLQTTDFSRKIFF